MGRISWQVFGIQFRKKRANTCRWSDTNVFLNPAGRYRVDQGPPVHKSKTCLVVFAIDIRTGALVALKMMCDREQFERELLCRFGSALDGGPPIDTASCVVGIQA